MIKQSTRGGDTGARPSWGENLSPRSLVGFALLALLAYPAGAIVRLTSEARWADMAGYGLIVLALFALIPVLSSRLYKIAAADDARLDEFEVQLRYRAMQNAYQVAAMLVLLSCLYLAIASDKGGWIPSEYEHFNAIIWGAILTFLLLPPLALGLRMAGMEGRHAADEG